MAYINGDQVLFSAKINGIVAIDDVMSDTSENPVQNKAIKTYVDDTVTAQVGEHVSQTINGITVNKLTPDMGKDNVGYIPTAAAVVNYVDKEWQQLHPDVDKLTQTSINWQTQVELFGDTTKGLRVMLFIPPNTTFANSRVVFNAMLNKGNDGIDRKISVRAEGWKTSASQTVCVFDIVPRAGVWNVDVAPYQKTVADVQGDVRCAAGDKVRYIVFQTADTNPLPVGTSIAVWGIK